MMRSLGSGVSGLRNHQVKMDVIANNIANVNTTAFKCGRVNFHEILSQNIRGNSMSNVGVGAINPAQIGLGVAVQAIDMLFSQGPPVTTNRALDMCIDGNGFFRVANGELGGEEFVVNEYFYTRDGSFYVDDDGYLVTAEGLHVLGRMSPDPDEGIGDDAGQPIRIFDPTAGDTSDLDDNLTTLRVDPNGMVFVNGRAEATAQVLLDNYANPENLAKLGSNLYEVPLDANGEDPMSDGWGAPASNGGQGKLISGALEMSNVDLSTEFAEMIKTQRGYQANARVITVSDEMLGELINLKR